MKKRLLIRAICLSIVALIILFFGCGKPRIQVPGVPRLEVSEDSWDFGTVKIGSVVKHTFIIKNSGGANLNFYPYSSCPACILVELESYSIPPKSEMKMNVKVVETQAGPYEGFITIDSNDPARPTVKLTIKGTFIKAS
jgi:hypothetical protein